jgi:hypothetical protein
MGRESMNLRGAGRTDRTAWLVEALLSRPDKTLGLLPGRAGEGRAADRAPGRRGCLRADDHVPRTRPASEGLQTKNSATLAPQYPDTARC